MAEHDQLFKSTFERVAEARSLLSSCLPREVARCIAWDSLKNASTELNAPALQRQQCDLLFKANVRHRDARLMLLVEHQSRVDAAMPLRMLQYTGRIWERHLRDHPTQPLPLVVPIVVFQGPGRWKAPTQLSGLLADVPPALAAFVPNAEFLLLDLSRMSDAQLRAKALSPAATMTVVALTRCRGVDAPERVLERWFDTLAAVATRPDGVNVLTSLGTYVALASGGEPAAMQVVFERLGSVGKEAFVTMAEKMVARAQQKGMSKWRKAGAASVLLLQLKRKFGAVPPETRRRLAAASRAQLSRWAAQLLDAKHLEDALR